MRTGRRLHTAGPATIGLKTTAVTGTKLAENRLVMTGQRRSGFVDGGKTTVEEIGVITDDKIDVRSMNSLLGFLISTCRNNAVDKVRLNITG